MASARASEYDSPQVRGHGGAHVPHPERRSSRSFWYCRELPAPRNETCTTRPCHVCTAYLRPPISLAFSDVCDSDLFDELATTRASSAAAVVVVCRRNDHAEG